MIVAAVATAGAADFSTEPADFPAERLPAVSGINGKFSLQGGGVNGGDVGVAPFLADPNDDFDGAFLALGAITLPVSHSFGFQADGVLGSVHEEFYGHVAGHFFWRDPSTALFGIVGGYSVWDDVDSFRAGVEAEGYFGQFTLRGLAGYEWGDVEEGLFTIADLAVYVTDDFRASIGHRYAESGGHALAASLEYQVHSGDVAGVSLYADRRLGEDDFQSILGGIKVYFGENKSLIRRHREDDPDFINEMQSLIQCTEEDTSGLSMVDGMTIPATQRCNADTAPVYLAPDTIGPVTTSIDN